MEGVAEGMASCWDETRDGWAWGKGQAGQRGCLRGWRKDRGTKGSRCQGWQGRGFPPYKGKGLAGTCTGCSPLGGCHPSALLHLGCPGGKAPRQRCNPLKKGGAQDTLHGWPLRSVPQAPKEGAALTLRGVDGSARETPATSVLQ